MQVSSMSTTDSNRQIDPLDLPAITVLVGHAGVGKTNTALGLALAHAARGLRVALCDLDVVNPYFRSSDYARELEEKGIELIAPVFAGTTLDTPSLSGRLDAVVERVTQAQAQAGRAPSPERLIIDVGGDDDGATTLGRYATQLRQAGVCVLYVASAYRSLTQTPEEAAAMLPDIEWHARLKADALLNTSNLSDQTTPEDVRRGRAFASRLSSLTGLPFAGSVVPRATIAALASEGPCQGEARALLASGGACEICGSSAPEIAALLTDADSPSEKLIMVPRFVSMPWEM